MVFGEGASVFVMPDDPNPDHGGGPVRRGGPQTVRMQPPIDVMVYRTPHQVVREGEPGARWPGITRDKFLPDGRLVRQGALGDFGGTTLDPEAALARVSAQYVALRKLQGRIVATHRKAGAPIPCGVMAGFNAAVRSYQRSGIVVLDAIRKLVPEATFFQIPVDMDGKPLLDTNGQPKRRTIDVPLHPGAFVLPPGCASLEGADVGAFGFGQGGELSDAGWKTYLAVGGLIVIGVGLIVIAAPAVAVAAAAVGVGASAAGAAASITTIAGGAALFIAALKTIKIMWPSDNDNHIAQQIAYTEARNACLDKAYARGVKGEAASKECGAALSPPKPPSTGIGILAWIGVGTLVVGGLVAARHFYRKRQRQLAPAAATA